MSPENRRIYVRYRLKRAFEAIEEADWMAQKKHWNTCANRLYYAAFYAVSALLMAHQHLTQTHKGVRTIFAQHFVKTGLVSLSMNDLYNSLFDKRQKGDYNDLFEWTEEDILPLIIPTRAFVQTIKSLLEDGGA